MVTGGLIDIICRFWRTHTFQKELKGNSRDLDWAVTGKDKFSEFFVYRL